MSGSSSRRHGFTLVELLVVIGIIAVLIGVLLPALNKAREQSKLVKCLSNLRQIGMGFQLYRQYNRDFYSPKELQRGLLNPAASVYFYGGNAADSAKYSQNYVDYGSDLRYINPYVRKNVQKGDLLDVFHCPSDDDGYSGYGNSYTGNYFSGSNHTPRFYTLLDPNDTRTGAVFHTTFKQVQIKGSSEFILCGENYGVSVAYSDTANVKNPKRFHYKDVNRWNMLFADGHAAAIDITAPKSQTGKDFPSSGNGWRFAWRFDN